MSQKGQKTSDTLIVCFDWGNEDHPILVIGRKRRNHDVDVINAIFGDEAKEMYKKLTEKKEDRKE